MKYQTNILGAIVLILTVFSSCATKKDQMQNNIETAQAFTIPTEIIFFSRGSCYGKCPEFDLRIYDDGKAILKGKNNLNHIGMYEYHLDENEMSALNQILDQTDFQSMKDEYVGQIADVPGVVILVNKDGKEKKIQGNWQFPEPLLTVFAHLDDYVFSEKWMPVKEEPVLHLNNKSIIPDRIIVNLIPGVEGDAWVKKYRQYEATVVKKVAPRMQLWVITYDLSKIDPMTFLSTIKLDKEVVQAEFDKKLKMREK
jgi:hypothetical protein